MLNAIIGRLPFWWRFALLKAVSASLSVKLTYPWLRWSAAECRLVIDNLPLDEAEARLRLASVELRA